eukprot:3678656-Karenia_brevis.AAC.1
MLAILDCTVSIICIGKLIGHQFLETLGVREGAVESPHAFNMYISPIRQKLEMEHPRICRLLHISISILLYADDAALPADSPEDLALSVQIFEQFCNENRLYISTAKTFVTVFHNESDTGVKYSDGVVFVDGQQILISVYGSTLKAVDHFKYLGVTLSATASAQKHIEARTAAQDQAIGALLAGVTRIPAYTHKFLLYLWKALVAPVGNYGMELFAFTDADVLQFASPIRAAWRKLLRISGRAPCEVTAVLTDITSCGIEWRVRRLAHLLRLLNAPPDSWQHVALLALKLMRSPWFIAAEADLHVLLPEIQLGIAVSSFGDFVYSTGFWCDDVWRSAQPFALRQDSLGRRHRSL